MPTNTDNVNANILDRWRPLVLENMDGALEDLDLFLDAWPEDVPVERAALQAALDSGELVGKDAKLAASALADLALCDYLLGAPVIATTEGVMELDLSAGRISLDRWRNHLDAGLREEIDAHLAQVGAVRSHTTDRERLERVAELGDDVASTATRLDTRAGLVSLADRVRALIDDERIDVYQVRNSLRWESRGEVVCVVVGPHSPVRNRELRQRAVVAALHLDLHVEYEADEYSTACYLWSEARPVEGWDDFANLVDGRHHAREDVLELCWDSERVLDRTRSYSDEEIEEITALSETDPLWQYPDEMWIRLATPTGERWYPAVELDYLEEYLMQGGSRR